MFKGSMVALVTPFNEDGSLDENSLKDLIKWHVDAKTDSIVLSGTTGEAPTLLDNEKLKIFEIAVTLAKGKTKIIAGTGTYSTHQSKFLTKKAKEIGVAGALVVVPYYNKPPIEGLIKHFEEIAEINLPIILYHHPGRTGTKLSIDSFIKLQKIDQIVAIKEASGSLELAKELIEKTRFDVLSGDDPLAIDMMKLGAKGVISVVANVIPKEFKKINDLCLNGDFEKAQNIYDEHRGLIQSMFLQTNPICVKYALSLLGKCKATMRLPLVEPNKIFCEKIKNQMKQNKNIIPQLSTVPL
ncbi:MAG: 4-hydroxy-tetrahydrodipicolinate synthase [Candidatus Anoxychlamydiales bacterium]|nr:4-hydroxy-tetrahydrodipicolinate synthase [Candidatus Anoxychlamydiales bacterium]